MSNYFPTVGCSSPIKVCIGLLSLVHSQAMWEKRDAFSPRSPTLLGNEAWIVHNMQGMELKPWGRSASCYTQELENLVVKLR